MSAKSKNGLVILGAAILVLGLGSLLIGWGAIDPYVTVVLNGAGISIILALSINLISGMTGQLALGHAGFMSIGAYVSAYFVMKLGMPIPVGLLAGGFLAAASGFIIGYPTLKLSGDYLAIATLGFGQIIQVVMVNLKDLTGGAAGLYGVPYFTPDKGMRDVANFLWIFGTLIAVLALFQNLKKSSYGRALIAIREDEIAARSMGINAFQYKMFAFVLSTFVAGVGGALYAHFYNYLNPAMFSFLKSIDLVIIVVFGGIGSFTGSIVAGFVLAFIAEGLRSLKTILAWKEIDDFRLVFYALILILIMLFKPSGLMGKRELSVTALGDSLGALARDPKAWIGRASERWRERRAAREEEAAKAKARKAARRQRNG
jgi:branched-chain amino acid transport system permease protein